MIKHLSFLILLCSAQVKAQDLTFFKPDSVRKAIVAKAISGDLHVDGLLKESEWSLAEPSPRFTMVEPIQLAQPHHETWVRALYNRKFLYVGVFSRDSLGKKAIRATDFKRDFDFQRHDLVTLTFDGFNDQRNAMALASNAYGVQRDLLAFDDNYYDVDWDGLWKVRTTRTDSGWYAEFAIPWQTLRYRNSADSLQSWGFNIYRNRRLSNEVTALSPFPRTMSSCRMDYAGLITGLKPPPPKPNVRIQPYLLSSWSEQRTDGKVDVTDMKAKLGGDLKWAVNPNAVLDLTVNTDFAQADADRQVNNTTRFDVFFPERRQFFLENASLFGFGIAKYPDESGGNMRIQPFFSRRIGLDDDGTPIPIQAGGRFVNRSSQRNYGAMIMRQKGGTDSTGTNFLVARFSENIGAQNHIGGMFTAKQRPSGSNLVGTVDGFFRWRDNNSVNTMVSMSSTSNTGKQGVSAYAQYMYINNHVKIWWTQSLVTKDYDPQLGFVSRKDVIGTTPGIFWWYRGKHLPFKKILRAYEPSIFPDFYHQASTGKLVERTWTVYPIWLNFQNGAYFGFSVTPTYQYLTEPFEPLGVHIPVGPYNYTRYQIYASSDPSRILNLQVIYNWGSYFGGQLNSGDWSLQFAPIPHFSLTARFNRNRFKGVGQPAADATVDLYSLEGRFALNPRLQLIGFWQQNSDNNTSNYNIRLSWEYQPLSYIYLVLNRRNFQDLTLKSITQDQVIAKVSYLKQF